MDNGSTDGTVSYLSQVYPNVSVISLKENKGIVIPHNLGASAARGSLISFLNNDTEVDPDWLLPLVLAVECNEDVAGCSSKFINYYERDKIDRHCGAGGLIDNYGNSVSRGGGEIDKGQFNAQEEIFYGLPIFKKDLFMDVGGFDESFFGYYDETDLCWRLHRFGYKILFVPESVIYHMGGSTSSDRSSKKKPKKIIVFHQYKNKLRMLIKNQFGFRLIFSVLIYLFDLCGTGIQSLLNGDQEYVPILAKTLIWNLKNFKGTLQNKISYKNPPTDFNKLFLPYSGIWKEKAHKLVNIKLSLVRHR